MRKTLLQLKSATFEPIGNFDPQDIASPFVPPCSHRLRPMFNVSELKKRTALRHIEYHETLDSTNRLANELICDLLPLSPALVLADKQTAGRGRGANQWWATAGALTFSLVLDADEVGIPAQHRPLISLTMGLAVRSVLSAALPDRVVAIKWPNDVLIDERKVCGILVEQHVTDGRSAIVAGVGINVNNSLADAPTDVRQRATSLFDLSGTSLSLDELLFDVLNSFDRRCAQLSVGSDELIAELNQRSLLNGRNIVLATANEQFSGRCEGIDPSGALRLITPEGSQAFVSGSIESWE